MKVRWRARTTTQELSQSHLLTDLMMRVGSERDRDAFVHLFNHFDPRIKAFLMKGGAGEQLAEDLCQETLLTVWRKAHLFNPNKAGAGTWIFTIARNLRVDAIRRTKRPNLIADEPMLLPSVPQGAEEHVAAVETEQQVCRAIDSLPLEQAAVIRLSFFKDMTHCEISDHLDLPLGTVKSRLRLGFAKVKTLVAHASWQ